MLFIKDTPGPLKYSRSIEWTTVDLVLLIKNKDVK